MKLRLSTENKNLKASLNLPGSKSISNRLLILRAFFPQLQIENLSDSDDTRVLQKALKSNENTIDVGHAGTAMRFLTAYFSVQKGRETILTGSPRMKERPIGILVEALRNLGADISYLEKEGFPPLKITGKKPASAKTSLEANVSSQYVSALMLIALAFPDGLEIELKNQPTSYPYIQMTQSVLEEIGIKCIFEKHKITIQNKVSLPEKPIFVEPDWSSASYFFSLVALSDSAEIILKNLKKNSIQGDSVLPEIYGALGVETSFSENGILLKKTKKPLPTSVDLNLSDNPDLAQTIAVSCLGLGIKCKLSGLHTLKIKETDRLLAMKTELEKFGAKVFLTGDSLEMEPPSKLQKNIKVKTYDDHRMAMAFAPLAIKTPIVIENPEVVSKSYPGFWEDFKKMGFELA
jgi:3-phosphoshikimate 1-carboxyvinyltransferase